MDAATWMPAVVAGITTTAPVIGMLLKAGYSKRKTDAVQDEQIARIAKAVQRVEEGRTENSGGIQTIREILSSTHEDIKSLAAEVRRHGVALAKQSFYMESSPPFERLLGGLSYICDYHEDGQTFRDIRRFAGEHPAELDAIFRFIKPEYRQEYEKRIREEKA